MAELKLAVVGTGNVARSYIEEARILKRLGLPVTVTLAFGRDIAQARSFAAEHGIERHAHRFEDVLTDSIDGVIVVTPMQEHAGMVMSALEAGKHVFCEKALAETAEAARGLASLASDRGLMLVTPPATPLNPVFRHALRHVHEGDLGHVHSARAIYGWAGPDWAGWFYRDGAGPLRDLGIYALATLTGLLGPVTSVSALAVNAEPQRNIRETNLSTPLPDTYTLALAFASGAVASLATGFSFQKTDSPGIELYGTHGSLVFSGQDWSDSGYRLWKNSEGHWRVYGDATEWRWTDGLRDFCEAIICGRPAELRLDHVLHVLDVIDAAHRSARVREPITVTSRFSPVSNPEAASGPAPHRLHKSN